jgi:hypothetical protein
MPQWNCTVSNNILDRYQFDKCQTSLANSCHINMVTERMQKYRLETYGEKHAAGHRKLSFFTNI